MFCLFLLCASLYINLPHTCICEPEVDPLPFEKIIQDYFKSESVRQCKKEWETLRKPVENALIMAMKDTVGLPGMNMYIRKREEKLASGYLHNDNQVRIILRNINLDALPLCVFPDVKFKLASNVLKIQTALSKMIIHADYALIRNQTDIIHDPKDQNPMKSSPFLFAQVQDFGKIAISMENCQLKGFITTVMNVDSINLGHDRFNIFNCEYSIEIYRPGEDSPPVIAKYNLAKNRHGLGLTDLLKKPLLTDELIPKLQAAIFSFVNTSAVFGPNLHECQENQEIVCKLTATELEGVVREMNKLTVEKNHGAIELADYEEHWDDGRRKPSKKNESGSSESLKLTEMVLTGLDTLYSAHAGGPFEFATPRIAEKLRFSSLQVRGKLGIESLWSDTFDFAAELSDLTLDLHMQLLKTETIGKLPDTWMKDRQLEVEGIREMTFTVPSLIFGAAESLIGGYLLKVIPKLINSHSVAMFDQAMKRRSETKPPNRETSGPSGKEDDGDTVVDTEYSEQSDDINTLHSDDLYSEGIQGGRERDTFKKSKKRFKSLNNPRQRRLNSGKLVANNKIRNK